MDERRAYPRDLTDEQWAVVEPYVTRPRRTDGRGRPPLVAVRAVVNAVRSVLREGCRWRSVPHDVPAWQTVYWYVARWTDDGTLVRLHDALHRHVREQLGRDPEPSAVISDRQSVKTSEQGGTPARTRASR